MKTKWDWVDGMSHLPDMSQEALKNYFLYALPPGGFLTSLLSNHPWTLVISRADTWNKPILGKYLLWLQEFAPAGSWGSEEAVQAWLAKGYDYQQFQKTVVWDALKEEHSNFEDPGF